MDDLTFSMKRSISMLQDDPDRAKEAFGDAAKEWCPSCEKFIRHRGGVEWCRDQKMSEKTLQSRIVDRAKRRGWDVKHVGKGIAAFDAAGNPIFVSTAKSFPDLFMLHPEMRRALAIECKRENGEFEPGQLEYLQLLNLCGIDAVVIRPSQLRDGTVNAILDGR
jgi:hypothetical protein